MWGPQAGKLLSPNRVNFLGMAQVLISEDRSSCKSEFNRRQQSSARSAGAWSLSNWKTKPTILNRIHWHVGYQCTWHSTGCKCRMRWCWDTLWYEVDVTCCWWQDAVSIEDSDMQLGVFRSLVRQLPPPHYRSVCRLHCSLLCWLWS